MTTVENNVQYVPVSLLKKCNTNPRVIKNRRFSKLCDSIKNDPKFLEMRPILCNKDYEIYAGNQRYAACVILGWKEVPCIVSDVSEEQRQARMLKDNLHAGEFDFQILHDKYDNNLVKDEFDDEKVFDILEDKEEKPKESRYAESMELKNFESHDYIVFAFDDSRDYINILQKLGIGKVDSSFSPKLSKIGIGRVLNGKVLADILRR